MLGLKWEHDSDVLSYEFTPNTVQYTKRAILSEIARIYDPLGLLTPVTTELKSLMKYLWTTGLGWDDVLPFACYNFGWCVKMSSADGKI